MGPVVEVTLKIIKSASGKIVHQRTFRFGEVNPNEGLDDFAARVVECFAKLRKRYPFPRYKHAVEVEDPLTRRVKKLLGLGE